MPKFNVTRRLPYTPDQVYAIASDVASYRAFLPLVRSSTVRSRKTLPDGRESFDAEMTVAYKKLGIEETTHSRVVCDPVKREVIAHATDGPVKKLETHWQVRELPDGTSEIDFSVDYALKSRSMQFLLSGMFDLVVRKIMTAFEDRARKLYGSEATTS
ncbi:MAG: type II toxin-antitoxin system RatA family toxin [Alphaproteobacteria bacterium]|nr:type II toxin-antitoxin system RatA family toxin [Alphaproteobacteria bacterium]